MTEPQPIRVTEAVRITRAAEVVETVRVVEYASLPPGDRQELAGELVPRGYSPERDSPAAGGVLHLEGSAPARQALPPAPARRRWWLW